MFCPFEDRYGTPEMRKILSEEVRLETMIEVIKSEMLALIELGLMEEDAKPLVLSLSLKKLGGIDRIRALEKEFGHEVLALVNAISEYLGEYGSLVSLGLSSPDIIDTATSIVVRRALALVERKLVDIIKKLLDISEKYSSTIFLSRTHLWPALPTTLDFVFVTYAYRLSHVLRLIEHFRRWGCYGKMSGPTGGYPALGKFQVEVEKKGLKILGLRPIEISFQWLPREYLAEMTFLLSLLCSLLAKIASDLLDLSTPDVGIFLFPKNPSSSSMPHKWNPLRIERIISIHRAISSLVISSLENVQEKEQGDSTKSLVERFSIPHAFLMTDQALEDMVWALDNLTVNSEKLKEEVSSKGALYAFSYNLFKELCLKGMPRKEAFELVFSLTVNSNSLEELKEKAKRDQTIKKFLKDEEIDLCQDLSPFIEGAKISVERAKKRIKIIINSLAI